MEITKALFYFFALIAVGSAAFIAFTNKIIYAAFALMASFLSIAAIYLYANADFIAITQIMIYVGGVLILIVFGVMLTNKLSGKALISPGSNYFFGILCGFCIFLLLFRSIRSLDFLSVLYNRNFKALNANSTKAIGFGIMSNYLLVFEIVAILLLVALVGSVILAGRKINSPKDNVK